MSVNLVHAGSSPHTRGLRVGGQGVGAPARIIPAHAGFTCCSPGWRPGRTDHPRTRGVYVARRLARELAGGSSPHTRGLLHRSSHRAVADGIIPAHAGFTRPGGGRHPDGADHPRTRGVYGRAAGPGWVGAGSSPHTRGLHPQALAGFSACRIIPAHAGFTRRRSPPSPPTGDHPRTRGVYTAAWPEMYSYCGSSPHTRGLRPPTWTTVFATRIIPAHAGFTSLVEFYVGGPGDHPRTRGVYWTCRRGRGRRGGSSPHTRGLPGSRMSSGANRRIIPAHAGFTGVWRGLRGAATDHPRTRGVYAL